MQFHESHVIRHVLYVFSRLSCLSKIYMYTFICMTPAHAFRESGSTQLTYAYE